MSRFNGKHPRGYVRNILRPLKREEAEQRNADYQKRLKAADELAELGQEIDRSEFRAKATQLVQENKEVLDRLKKSGD